MSESLPSDPFERTLGWAQAVQPTYADMYSSVSEADLQMCAIVRLLLGWQSRMYSAFDVWVYNNCSEAAAARLFQIPDFADFAYVITDEACDEVIDELQKAAITFADELGLPPRFWEDAQQCQELRSNVDPFYLVSNYMKPQETRWPAAQIARAGFRLLDAEPDCWKAGRRMLRAVLQFCTARPQSERSSELEVMLSDCSLEHTNASNSPAGEHEQLSAMP